MYHVCLKSQSSNLFSSGHDRWETALVLQQPRFRLYLRTSICAAISSYVHYHVPCKIRPRKFLSTVREKPNIFLEGYRTTYFWPCLNMRLHAVIRPRLWAERCNKSSVRAAISRVGYVNFCYLHPLGLTIRLEIFSSWVLLGSSNVCRLYSCDAYCVRSSHGYMQLHLE